MPPSLASKFVGCAILQLRICSRVLDVGQNIIEDGIEYNTGEGHTPDEPKASDKVIGSAGSCNVTLGQRSHNCRQQDRHD